MIYLIDDKIIRQEKDYKWTSERFKKYKSFISPIYTLNELENKAPDIFKDGNVILYHESFLDNTNLFNEASERRRKLVNFAKNKSSYLVFFSGSMNTRELNDNTGNLPVSILYKNLEIFIRKYSEDDINLEYLLFGENHKIEKELSEKLNSALLKTINEPVSNAQTSNLFIRPPRNNINNPLNNCVEKTIFNTLNDKELSELLNEWLNENKYQNIFIPLCLGNTLSDFNGLRLSCHVRCTKSLNQNSRIYVYGFVGTESLLQNEYFNILKTKNTFLIPFSKVAIGESANKESEIFSFEEIPNEMKKLNLNVPSNYFDNHSIANEFGIYHLAYNAGIEINEITDFDKEKLNSLYFKWLITINGLYEELPQEVQQENNDYRNAIRLNGPTIVGQIDLTKVPKK